MTFDEKNDGVWQDLPLTKPSLQPTVCHYLSNSCNVPDKCTLVHRESDRGESKRNSFSFQLIRQAQLEGGADVFASKSGEQ